MCVIPSTDLYKKIRNWIFQCLLQNQNRLQFMIKFYRSEQEISHCISKDDHSARLIATCWWEHRNYTLLLYILLANIPGVLKCFHFYEFLYDIILQSLPVHRPCKLKSP